MFPVSFNLSQLHNKFFTNDTGFDWAVGYQEMDSGHPKPYRATARVVRVAKCPAIGLNDVVPLGKSHDINFRRGHSNAVLEKYNQYNKPLKTDWEEQACDENVLVSSLTPTVSTGGFTCDYYLEVRRFTIASVALCL